MEQPRFTRIKYDGDTVELEFFVLVGATKFASDMSSPDAPGAEFEHALQAFKADVIKLIGLPKQWQIDVVIRSVSISYKNDYQNRGVVISFIKPIERANSPVNISTPYLPEPEEGDTGVGMTPAMIDHLDQLEKLAGLYLAGKTGQVDLFKQQTRETAAENGNGAHPPRQRDLEHEAAVQERRIRAALLEIAPSITTDRVVEDEHILQAIARRWESIEYFDPDAQDSKDRKYPGVHKHYYNDQDGQGVMWCGTNVAEFTGPGGHTITRVRFWHDIMPELFYAEVLTMSPNMIGGIELVKIYRELLQLPASSNDVENPEAVPAGVAE